MVVVGYYRQTDGVVQQDDRPATPSGQLRDLATRCSVHFL